MIALSVLIYFELCIRQNEAKTMSFIKGTLIGRRSSSAITPRRWLLKSLKGTSNYDDSDASNIALADPTVRLAGAHAPDGTQRAAGPSLGDHDRRRGLLCRRCRW